jgi:hypothetical protein
MQEGTRDPAIFEPLLTEGVQVVKYRTVGERHERTSLVTLKRFDENEAGDTTVAPWPRRDDSHSRPDDRIFVDGN